MATATGTYIAVDELRATLSSTTANYVSELYATGDTTTAQLVRRMWLNDSSNIATIVWDVWNTVLTASNFNMPSSGGNVEDYISVESYGTDVEGSNHSLGYSVSPSSVSPTTSGSTTSKAVTVTQEGSGESVQLTAYIAGRVAVDTTYLTPTVTSTSISSVPASGNVTRYLTVNWSQVKVITYDNGTTSTSTVTGSSTATVTSGSVNNSSGAYISGGGVYVPSAGTTYYTSQRTAYTISQFNFTANGVASGTVSKTVYVYQSANTRTSTTEYSVSTGVASVSTIANTGGSFTFTATCQSRPIYTYASGSTENGSWSDASASVSYSNGVSSVSPTSFTGSTTVTATIGENISSQRYPRVTVKATGDTSVSDYTQVTQSAVSYTFTAMSTTSIELAGTSTSFSVSVRSERNGKPWAISSSNVSAGSYASVSGVVQSSYPTYQYNVNLTTSSNTSSSDRSYSITVTQPDSGKSLTFNVTHKTVSSGLPIEMVWKYSNGNYCTSSGWYLGQVPTGGTTNGRPVYHIVAVTTSGNTQAASIYANFTYTYNPSDAAGNISGSINKSFSYTSGGTISINGKSYYGVILVTGLPAISQGTVSGFTVTKT